ncbi:MAG: hypothetical protein QOJ94_1693, partial [Sphingomonadales bacterium]|nr:hypothetical protein [Sphingomonadales bacterium]
MADRNRDRSTDPQPSQPGSGRGERFDEAQGGGRSWQDVSPAGD